MWMAFVSPTMTKRGEWRDTPEIHTNQAAATLAGWMGLDWKALRPSAGATVRAD